MPPKKHGVSFDEKKSRMLDFFYEKKEFFHLKEIEKLVPKCKGITPMSVKEVVQALVDDGFINCEKVGSSSYYWVFKSQTYNQKQNKLKRLQGQFQSLQTKHEKVLDQLSEARKNRQTSLERDEALKKISFLSTKKEDLMKEIMKYEENDPSKIKQLATETVTAKQAVNRWTDNLFTLKAWIKRKFPVDEKQIDKQFGIPEDIDYI
ncbi:meiotic nuclear division protein 1 homolog isoform X2 [Clavelina lepadiformis]|uniref:meiotic nuclear division protein 1 homolog isoform X2 n=1 Tax=Clavelina lepadiformis TaxID=159417 RepID=UPI0040432184